MSVKRFWITYAILALCQILLGNYCNFTPLVYVSLLPAMVICIPIGIKTPWAMVIAFFTALAVDFICDGVPGLNALALVPVAFCRAGIFRMILGTDIADRRDVLSLKSKGFGKISWILLIAIALFFAVYILADGAGTRTLAFDAIRFVCSGIASFALSLIVVEVLSPRVKS